MRHQAKKRTFFFSFIASYLGWNSGTPTTLHAIATETTPAKRSARLTAATEKKHKLYMESAARRAKVLSVLLSCDIFNMAAAFF